MKRKKKTWLAGLFAAILMTLLFCVTVQAGTQNPFKPSKKYGGYLPLEYQHRQMLSSYWPQSPHYMTPCYKKNFTMKAVSTNKKVATVKIETVKIKGGYSKLLYIIPKSTGRTNIQVTVKVKGKTYKKTFPYQVDKYENPFSSFKINGKNYATKFNKLKSGKKVAIGSVKYADWTPPQGKLSYKLKKNYKIVWMDAVYKNGETITSGVRNNRALPKKCAGFWIGYENTKTKAYGELFIGKK